MKDEMDKDLGGAVATEEEAVKAFEAMTAAKKSEIAAASEAIESKSVRSGAPAGFQIAIGESGGMEMNIRSAVCSTVWHCRVLTSLITSVDCCLAYRQ